MSTVQVAAFERGTGQRGPWRRQIRPAGGQAHQDGFEAIAVHVSMQVANCASTAQPAFVSVGSCELMSKPATETCAFTSTDLGSRSCRLKNGFQGLSLQGFLTDELA